MNRFTKSILLVIILSAVSQYIYSQSIENVRTNIEGGEVTITYDLLGSDTSQIFEIRLYSAIDNYRQRLYRGVGEVGRDIRPGRNKQIVWNNREELTAYKLNDMDFTLEATLIYSPIIFTSPVANATHKRGNAVKLNWIGGESFERLRVEVFQNNVKLRNIETITNRGSYVWKIPSNIAPGQGYQFKLTRETSPDDGVFSNRFNIERRIPTLIKVLPVAAIGIAGVTYFILSGGGGGGTPDEILPAPVNPQ
ncbi:hypothetical protein BH23BAC1_BH23BAC1_48060 [soil metagenome]